MIGKEKKAIQMLKKHLHKSLKKKSNSFCIQSTRFIEITYIDFHSLKLYVNLFIFFYPKDQIEMVKVVFSILISHHPKTAHKKVKNYFE